MAPTTESLARPRWIRLFLCLMALLSASSLPPNPALAQQGVGQPRAITPRGELAADEKATIDLFERTRESVVYITTSSRVRDIWTRNVYSVPRGTGSGFVWDDAGHVITNFHVIENASEALVKLADGREFKASLVGVSKAHDLAVLRIKIPNRRPAPVPIGTSHDLRVGQKVYAIGNPFGLDWTLTTGIVSALDRSLGGEDGNSIDHLVQTDAAINPGNSGGPLLDSAGRLIGVNTAIYSPSGASAGIGFAIPVDEVNRIVPRLIREGRIRRPVLGIAAASPAFNKALGLPPGVAILRVDPDGPAARAGLKPFVPVTEGSVVVGDLIVAIDGTPTPDLDTLLDALERYRPGDTVTLDVLRGTERRQVAVTLDSSS